MTCLILPFVMVFELTYFVCTNVRKQVFERQFFVFFEYITQPDFHLGATSKLNRWSTGGSVRFRAVVIVSNNRNQPEAEGTAGPVNQWLGFEAKQTKNKTNKLKKKKKKKKKNAFWKLCPILLPFVVVEQHSYLLIKFTKHQMWFSQCWTHWWAVSYMQLRGILKLFQQRSLTSITYTCSITN